MFDMNEHHHNIIKQMLVLLAITFKCSRYVVITADLNGPCHLPVVYNSHHNTLLCPQTACI